MKRGIYILIAMLAAMTVSCSVEHPLDGADTPTKTLRLEVEPISAGVQAATRASIPPEDGEAQVNNLYLLFYANQSDGGGAHVKTLTGADLGGAPLAMNGNYEIPLGGGIEATGTYTILAMANLPGYLDGQSEAEFIALLETLTERQAMERTAVVRSGVDIDEDDNSKAILPENLFMSARVVLAPDDEVLVVKFKRGVVRFDVYLDQTVVLPGFKLVSASIWGAAPQTPVWNDRMPDIPEHLQRFYGVENENGFPDGKIVGGLYAFENYVSNPEPADRVTTCVIIGLEDVMADAIGTVGEVYYYRVNVNPMGASQDLRRNNAYRIRVNSVDAIGEDTEYGAWSQMHPKLNVSINEWNIDDNGMVITDGVSTMVLPVKLVRLDPRGDARDFSIFTIGGHTLEISKDGLPNGIEASLDGSLLQVTATALGGGGERRGSIEISYGDLRGAISFVQAPDNSRFLSLNRYEVPQHAATGRGGVSDRVPFEVTASGPWTAKIYNMSDDDDNPGFSFTSSGAPITTLRSSQNPLGNTFQIYTTGDNTSNSDLRNGFVTVTLDEDPVSFSRVVVLAQGPAAEIDFNPDMPSPLRFSPAGTPLGGEGATAEAGFVFDVAPGHSAGGLINTWTVTPGSGDTQYFETTALSAGSVNRLTIKAIGTNPAYPHKNLSGGPLTATFVVTAGGATREFIVTQSRMDISVSTGSTRVSNMGGNVQPVTINIDPSLSWVAEIESNTGQAGYLVLNGVNVGTAITTPQAASVTLSAGFPKVYYPLVGVSPKMTVRVTVDGEQNKPVEQRISTTFTVTQDALNPAPMNILDVRNTSYGSLIGPGSYISYYRSYLGYAAMFGPTGIVHTGEFRITGQAADPTAISSEYVYLHIGGRPGEEYSRTRHEAVNQWWDKYGKERLAYYFMEDNTIFEGATNRRYPTILSKLGIAGGRPSTGTPQLNTGVAATPLYKFLVEDGPFGPSGQFGYCYKDGVHTVVYASTLPESAVPLIVDDSNPNNVFLFVDPVNNLIYQGESQIFDTYIDAPAITMNGTSTTPYANLSRFLANLQAYVLNAAQYGSHYTDLFLPENGALYDEAFK